MSVPVEAIDVMRDGEEPASRPWSIRFAPPLLPSSSSLPRLLRT